jgi:small-conductance mechanosensitive channel
LGLLSRLILSPNSPALRFLPMDGETAGYLHRWMIRIAVVGVFGWLTAGMLRGHKINEAFTFLLVVVIGFVIALMIALMVLQKRGLVADMLRRGAPETSLRALSAGSWHILAIAYVLIFWSFWVFSLLVLGDRATLAGAATILVVPLFFFFDWLAGRLVHTALGMAKIHEGAAGDAETEEAAATYETTAAAEEADASEDAVKEVAEARAAAGVSAETKERKWGMNRTYRILRRGFRFAIAALLFFWILGVWGIELPIAESVAESILKILLTVVLGYVIWEVINAFIERRLKTIQAGPEGGGAGGNRFRTLVQLARKFVLVVLITMVSLIVLSSMGIEIGPLLAGAGVVGLAIGFGSQALVKDIVSGVFFLMDDAFRIGDYIEVGSAKGVVEHISIRSLRLRHHRGMVYTIPFGGLKEVKNLTRDYIIMKLEFRVPFDTDVDKVRKIIKKINKSISAHEELGPKLLGKIKSQGVKEYDDSAMVMRVKFTTKPGEQFQIRKEVYKQLREQFAKAGIEFATRKVMVQIPPEVEMNEETKKAAAAAAQAAVDAQQAAGSAKG